MRFLWIIHLYPPYHNCGAEYMAHSLNKYLISQGHSVKVLLKMARDRNPKSIYSVDDVMVFPSTTNPDPLLLSTDVVLTHLDYTREAIMLAKQFNKKCIQFVHNHYPYDSVIENPWVKVVYNSQWVKEGLAYSNDSMVMRPPCDYRHYDVRFGEGEYVTLINLDYNKGGHILREIATRMPEKKFLAVKGSYSYNEDGQYVDQPGNVTVIENTSNILDVYRKTRVLIMPSLYESWGRTATEAMCNGIPVVVTQTKGLKENCDYAGLYVKDRDDIDSWVKWIKKLDDKKFYTAQSDKCRKRSRELDPINEMRGFLNWVSRFS